MAKIVVAHNPKWKEDFREEAAAICSALNGTSIEIHHIGSTAIPGILAKPIIDLLGAVQNLETIDAQVIALENLGYEALGAYGIEGRRYLRKINLEGLRTHHLHIFEMGSPHVERHLAFRDYLIANPDVAADYSAVKENLASDPNSTWDSYIDGKNPFMRATERNAVAWYQEQQSG